MIQIFCKEEGDQELKGGGRRKGEKGENEHVLTLQQESNQHTLQITSGKNES